MKRVRRVFSILPFARANRFGYEGIIAYYWLKIMSLIYNLYLPQKFYTKEWILQRIGYKYGRYFSSRKKG